MSRNIGEVRVSVLPDGTRFKPEATADLKKAVANMQAKIPLVTDSARFKAEAEKAVREAGAMKATVKIDGDAKPLDAKLAELAARSKALQESLGKLKVKDDGGILSAMAKQAENLRNSLDKVGDEQGLARASAQLQKMVETTDRVRQAVGKTTFAEEEMAKAAQDAAAKSVAASTRDSSSFAKAEAAKAKAAQTSQDRIAKARQQDLFDESRRITATRDMYAKLFDDLDKRDKIKIGVDGQYTDAQMAKIRAKIDVLTRKANLRLGLDPGDTVSRAARLREEVKLLLGNIRAKVTLDENSSKSFLAKMFGLRKAAGDAGGGAGISFGNSFAAKLGRSALFQNPGITALIVGGLAALPAALGAVGTLGGIALGAGIVFAADKMIQSQIKTLTTNLKSAQAAVGKAASPTTIASQQLAIQSTQATIARLSASNKLTASQQQQLAIAKQRLVIQKQTLAASQGKGQGTAAQQAQIKADQQQLAVYNQDLQAFKKLNGAVANLRLAFIQFAIVTSKPLLGPFTNAVNYLSAQLKGPLGTAFRNLFQAVGPLVKPVEQSLLEIVKGILPGMTDMLNQARKPLADMFIGFGKIVGLHIGQWFRDAIPFMKDSVHYFLTLIDVLGTIGSYLVKFGGQTARAFADPALKGFGPILERIANDLVKLVRPALEGWIEVMAPVTKALAKIILPLLDFIANNPALVKGIAEMAAAWFLAAKAIAVVNIALKLLKIEALSNPWVALAAVIILVTILIIKHWKPISAFFAKIWHDIYQGFISPLINFFTKSVPHAFDVTLQWIKKNWPLLLALIPGPFGLAVGLIIKFHNQIFNAVKSAWGHIENAITGFVKPIGSVIVGVWNEVFKVSNAIWGKIYGAIRLYVLASLGIVGQAWRGIKNLTGLVWPWIYNTTKDAWGHVENVVTGVAKTVRNYVNNAWIFIKNITGAVWGWVFNTIKAAWGHIENATTGIVKPIVSFISSSWNFIKRITSDTWNWIFNLMKSVWNKISSEVSSTVSRMLGNLHNAWTTVANWTRTTWNTIHDDIVNPLTKAWGWVENTFVRGIKGAFSGLVSSVKAIWDGLKKVVADPLNFVGGLWNKFAGFVNAGLSIFGIKSKLPQAPVLKFAKGGHVPGYAPGKDTVPAMLSPGEFVINPMAAKKIGKANLEALNNVSKPGNGVAHNVRNAYATGGDVVRDAEQWRGHPYRWGGGANPTTGWDCSSFVNYIVGHDFRLNLPGGGSWDTETAGGRAHGPVAAAYNNWGYGRRVPWADAKMGDLAIENNGAHIGFVAQDNTSHKNENLQGFAAIGTAFGTNFQKFDPGSFHLVRFADDRGFLAQAAGLVGDILKPAAQAALNGIEGIINTGLNHIPGTGPIKDLAKASVDDVLNAAKNALNNNSSNWDFLGGGAWGPEGVGTSAGEMANGKQLYLYLLNNLFNGNKVAAAGATASIWGESAWNPFAQGTGGRGLIGWTPPSTISDAAFKGGMATQLPAIIKFVVDSGDNGAIAQMETAHSVLDAANIWGKKVERYGINDVHATGVALATMIMNSAGGATAAGTSAHPQSGGIGSRHFAGGGPVQHFATGGSVAGLAGAQAAEKSAYNQVTAGAARAFAHPSTYVKKHEKTLKGELATLKKHQAKEQADYGKLSGKGLTSSNFRKFLTAAHSVRTTARDKDINQVEPALTVNLENAVNALDKLKFAASKTASKGKGSAKLPSTATLSARQQAEAAAYGALVSGTKGALAHPSGYVKSHASTLKGELATLAKHQAKEQADYARLSGKGLTSSNYARYLAGTHSVRTTARDKALSTAEPGLATNLVRALDIIEGVAAPAAVSGSSGGSTATPKVSAAAKKAAAIDAYNRMTVTAAAWQAAEQTAYGKLSPAEQHALAYRESREELAYSRLINAGVLKGDPSGIANSARSMLGVTRDKNLSNTLRHLANLSPASSAAHAVNNSSPGNSGGSLAGGETLSQYLANLKEVRGLPLSAIQNSAHLKHVWHLLHEQHLADENKLASSTKIPTHVFDQGGTLAPGINAVYNLTGKPEHLKPANPGSGDQRVTLEVVGGDSEVEQFMLRMIRRFVRVKGAGNVQKAFGRNF